jgi:regulator of cell morphogenesis and NO signaling
MAFLNHSMKMADVIHGNYLLIPVINRLGIHLGFGDKSVKNICADHGIDIDFFLMILNTFSNEKYFPEHRLQTVNILVFIKYLRKTHEYYLSVQIPLIESLIDKLISTEEQTNKNLKLIRSFFLDYKIELNEHIQREERITFPYIENMYSLFYEKFDDQKYKQITRKYSMKRFVEEHSDIDVKLCDLQNLLIKYIACPNEENVTNAIVFELFRLEKDIRDHTRLEEKILRPMVVELENTLKTVID